MSWFKRHLNWAYLLALVFSIILAILVGVVSGFVNAVANKPYPLYGLHMYLDESYTRLWSATDIPNFDELSWTSPDSNGWQTAIFTAYLENRGRLELEVTFIATEDPRFTTPGFVASSDPVVLKPNERSPVKITISRNLAIQSTISPEAAWESVYFEVQPVSLNENVVDLSYWLTAIPLMIGSAGWVLHQKGRSYAWLLLSLSGIGIIIILCLENKRLISGPEAGESR